MKLNHIYLSEGQTKYLKLLLKRQLAWPVLHLSRGEGIALLNEREEETNICLEILNGITTTEISEEFQDKDLEEEDLEYYKTIEYSQAEILNFDEYLKAIEARYALIKELRVSDYDRVAEGGANEYILRNTTPPNYKIVEQHNMEDFPYFK